MTPEPQAITVIAIAAFVALALDAATNIYERRSRYRVRYPTLWPVRKWWRRLRRWTQ